MTGFSCVLKIYEVTLTVLKVITTTAAAVYMLTIYMVVITMRVYTVTTRQTFDMVTSDKVLLFMSFN